ncbi:MAG: hypothetical protein R3A11_01075 [Bdellovibrionota bacterium]
MLQRFSLFSLMVIAMVTQSSVCVADVKEDRVWVEYKLSSVYRSPQPESLESLKLYLKKELNLWTADELKEATYFIAEICPPLFAKREKKQGLSSSDQLMYARCIQYKKTLSESTLPNSLATKALDALKELEKRKLVLVERGSMYPHRPTVYWDRTGVMPEHVFIQIASDGMGTNLTGSRNGVYMFEQNTYPMQYDLVQAIDYLEFTDSYDVSTRSWTARYSDESIEAKIVKITLEAIAHKENQDRYFAHAPAIKNKVSNELVELVAMISSMEKIQQDESLRKEINAIVETVIEEEAEE